MPDNEKISKKLGPYLMVPVQLNSKLHFDEYLITYNELLEDDDK